MFLDSHIDVSEWYREYQYSVDGRRERYKQYMAIDFLIRKKHTSLDRYIALELKQNKNPSACIDAMMIDVIKISNIKQSQSDLRSMWGLGVHRSINDDELYKRIEHYKNKHDVVLEQKCLVNRKIKNTNFSYTLF